MTALLAVLAAAGLLATVVLLVDRRRTAGRLLAAGHELDPQMNPTGPGLAAATALVERAAEHAAERGDQVARSELRLIDAMGRIPQALILYDRAGGIAFANDAAARYLTARHSEALVEEAIAEMAASAASGATRAPMTVDLFGPPRRSIVVSATALADDVGSDGRPGATGQGTDVLVVVEDVTDRRRLEDVRRDFVANISHELKTPVGALSLLAETLLSEDDPAVTKRLTARLLSEAERVGRTIDDLLELSQIEAGGVSRREEVPVHLFVAEAVDRVRPAAEQQEIAIDVEEPARDLVVVGDRRQLVSAAYNLLDNAVKYSDAGATVVVRARPTGGAVEVCIQDHGVGIPTRDLERVFERFYRVDRARSRETGGTGLGLAIVRHVAANHAGDVGVESVEGEGSTFTLRLPSAVGAPAASHEVG